MNRLFLVIAIIMTGTSASSGDLTWGFKSPSFHHGNGYSTHVLSVEQLQFNRKEDIRKEAEAEQERIEREALAAAAPSRDEIFDQQLADEAVARLKQTRAANE